MECNSAVEMALLLDAKKAERWVAKRVVYSAALMECESAGEKVAKTVVRMAG